MTIEIANRRRSIEKLIKENPSAKIIDVTSKSQTKYVKLSPFYPVGQIPIPANDGHYSESIEGIWQGLKVFEKYDIDPTKFNITNMKGLKRTVRRYGKVIGHKKQIDGAELLNYRQARNQLYIPAYEWVIKNRTIDLILEIAEFSKTGRVILLDYETNQDIQDMNKPLSHAALIKHFIDMNF